MVDFQNALTDTQIECADVELGPISFTFIQSPRQLAHVLTDSRQIYTKSDIDRRAVGLLIGNGLILSDGPTHRRRRKLIMPCFTAERLAGFVSTMSSVAEKELKLMQLEQQQHGLVNISDTNVRATLSIIGLCGFGVDLGVNSSTVCKSSEIVLSYVARLARSVLTLPLFIPTPDNVSFLEARGALDKIVYDVISSRKEKLALFRGQQQQSQLQHSTTASPHTPTPTLSSFSSPLQAENLTAVAAAQTQSSSSSSSSSSHTHSASSTATVGAPALSRCPMDAETLSSAVAGNPSSSPQLPQVSRPISDILDLLLSAVDEDGQPLTDLELRDEVMTMVLAGHETSANAMSWAMYYCSLHPEVCVKVREEIARVVGPTAPVSLQHLPELQYCEALLREVVRLKPAAWAFDRQASEADVLPGGHVVKKGSYLLLSPYATHRNTTFFEVVMLATWLRAYEPVLHESSLPVRNEANITLRSVLPFIMSLKPLSLGGRLLQESPVLLLVDGRVLLGVAVVREWW
ncbi:MAG: hypothetical protein WDW38_003458 [Sanguina aurantia]